MRKTEEESVFFLLIGEYCFEDCDISPPSQSDRLGRARVLSPLFLFFFGLAVISARKKRRQRFPTTEAQVIYFKPSGLMKRKWRQWKEEKSLAALQPPTRHKGEKIRALLFP